MLQTMSNQPTFQFGHKTYHMFIAYENTSCLHNLFLCYIFFFLKYAKLSLKLKGWVIVWSNCQHGSFTLSLKVNVFAWRKRMIKRTKFQQSLAQKHYFFGKKTFICLSCSKWISKDNAQVNNVTPTYELWHIFSILISLL